MAETAEDKVGPEMSGRYHPSDYETVRAHGFSDYDIDIIKSSEHLKNIDPHKSPWVRNNLVQEIIWSGWSPKLSLLTAVFFLTAFLIVLSNPTALNLGLAPILLAGGIFNILDIEDQRLADWTSTLNRLNSPIFRQVKFKGQTIMNILGVGLLLALIVIVLGVILTFFHSFSDTIEEMILGATGIIYLAYDVFYFARQRNRERAAEQIIAQALVLDVQEEPEPVRTPAKPAAAKMPPLTPEVKLPGDQHDENF